MKRPEMSVRERMLAVYQGQAVDKPALGIYQRYLPRGGKETQVRQNGMGLICYHPSVGTLYQESCLDAGGVGSEYISKHYITDIEDYKIMSYLVENTVFSPNKDYLSHSMEDLGDAGVMLDAMADAALFSMEAGLQRGLKAACKEWIRGIERRLEAPRDIPMEIQREAFWQCEAERTLQLGLTEGFLFSPLKTSCQIYITTENTDVFRAAHTCRKCPQLSCAMRHEEPLEIRIVTEEGEEGQTIVYETGTVWEAIREKAEGNSFPCGGSGHCGKCGIQVLQGELPVSREDKQKFTQAELEQGWRLACRAKPVESITIKLGWQKETKIRAVAGFSQAAVTEAMLEEKVISQKQREE